jgi:hypothetical protein
LEAVTGISDYGEGAGDDEMMELWWGDKARVSGEEIRTYVRTNEDTETFIGGRVGYDSVHAPLKAAEGFAQLPPGAREFTVLVSAGAESRDALIWQDSQSGEYRVRIYRDKHSNAQPIVEFGADAIVYAVDEATKNGVSRQAYRGYKLLEVSEDGKTLLIWISNALDISNDTLWNPRQLMSQVRERAGEVPPVSLIGGEDAELVEKVFLPSWDYYNSWQAAALLGLIEENDYELVFSHLHNVDCAGHQFWHLAKTLAPWAHTDEAVYRDFIEKVYIQTDNYLGEFLGLLEQGWTIFILSDHGLLVGENVPPLLGEYGGLNVPVMEALGYTVMKKNTDGESTEELDWSKTSAVQIRSNYIYINLRGRDSHGIIEPAEKYALEEKIISDLYGYRDPESGRRVVGIALRRKDAIALGVGGPESGDIFFTIEEGFNRLHGDGLSTAEGCGDTSTGPVFIAAGAGIRRGLNTPRTIRQVDVATTAAELLGLRPPAQSEGGILHQILLSGDCELLRFYGN